MLEDRCLLSAAPTGLSPAQVETAYNLSGLSFSVGGGTYAANGTGETIAVVVAYHDPYLASDLAKFDAQYGLPAASLSQVDQAGSTTNTGWAEEETLDVEWAHALAPAASIVVVEAASDNTSDLLNAVNTARYIPSVSVVSMSWGGAETRNETQYDGYFTTPAGHQGITFVAAAGDSSGAEWPATSPNVLSVGGTTLSIGSSGTYQSESTWTSTGGGYSLYEAEPTYQYSLQSTGRRSSPDVAFDANPNTGVSVYTTDPSTGAGSWQTVGGTSVGAPAWSAIIADIDMGLNYTKVPTLNGATQTLPDLYKAAADFHTVSTTYSYFGATSSTITSTGLGTPIVSALFKSIVTGATSVTASSPIPVGTTTTTTTTTTTPTTGTTTTGGTTTTTGNGYGYGGFSYNGGTYIYIPGYGWYYFAGYTGYGRGSGGRGYAAQPQSVSATGYRPPVSEAPTPAKPVTPPTTTVAAKTTTTAAATVKAAVSAVQPALTATLSTVQTIVQSQALGLIAPTAVAVPTALQNLPLVNQAIDKVIREWDAGF